MFVPDFWKTPPAKEAAARKDFFALMEWVHAMQYTPSPLEWTMIQQVFDELHFRHADTLAIIGFVVGLPAAKKTGFLNNKDFSQRSLARRLVVPAFMSAFGYELGLRSTLSAPAEEFWHTVTRFDSELGAAARRIRVLEHSLSRLDLHSTDLRYLHGVVSSGTYKGYGETSRRIMNLTAPFTLRDSLSSLIMGTAVLHRRPPVVSDLKGTLQQPQQQQQQQQTPPAGSVGGDAQAAAKQQQAVSNAALQHQQQQKLRETLNGTAITDVFRLCLTTRFATWTPVYWMHVATPTTKFNSISFGIPRHTGESDVVRWTLRSRDLIEANATLGAGLWWRLHLAAFSMFSTPPAGTTVLRVRKPNKVGPFTPRDPPPPKSPPPSPPPPPS